MNHNRFCGLLQFHVSIRNKALNQLMLFLGHPYPRVSGGGVYNWLHVWIGS